MRIATLRLHTSGQWMVKLGGKCHYLGTDKAAATLQYRDLIVEFYGPSKVLPALDPDGITVAELMSRFVEAVLAECSPRWRENKRCVYKQVNRHLVEHYGSLPAEDFGPKAYKAVRVLMASEKGRSYTYINMLCTRLKAAWRWGVSEELVSESSYRRLLTVPDLEPGSLGLADGKEVLPVKKALYESTLPYLTDACADFLRLLWITGARPKELIDLTPAELEKDDRHWVYRPKHHKTRKKNKLRAIVFGAESEAILKKYWPRKVQERFFAFYSDAAVIRNAVYRACARARLPRWHPYQLRHAAVTRIALEHGKEVAAAVAGHANVLTTERYDHGAVERAKRAAG